MNVLKRCTALGLIALTLLPAVGSPVHAQAADAFRLVGTIEGESGFSGAVLDDNTGTQTFYRLREPLPDGSRIVKIESDHISIKRNDGTSYQLYLLQSAKSGGQPAKGAVSAPVPAVPAQSPMVPPPPSDQQRFSAPSANPPRSGVPQTGARGRRRSSHAGSSEN